MNIMYLYFPLLIGLANSHNHPKLIESDEKNNFKSTRLLGFQVHVDNTKMKGVSTEASMCHAVQSDIHGVPWSIFFRMKIRDQS